jgi:uncharacterized caspase-like protein
VNLVERSIPGEHLVKKVFAAHGGRADGRYPLTAAEAARRDVHRVGMPDDR